MSQYHSFKDVRRGDSFYDAIALMESPGSSTSASFDRSISSSGLIGRQRAPSRQSGRFLSATDEWLPVTGRSRGGSPSRAHSTARSASVSAAHTAHHIPARRSVHSTAMRSSVAQVSDAPADDWSVLFGSLEEAERYFARHNLPTTALRQGHGSGGSIMHDSENGAVTQEALPRVCSRSELRRRSSSTPLRQTSTSFTGEQMTLAASDVACNPLGPLPPTTKLPSAAVNGGRSGTPSANDTESCAASLASPTSTSVTSSAWREVGGAVSLSSVVPLTGIRTRSATPAPSVTMSAPVVSLVATDVTSALTASTGPDNRTSAPPAKRLRAVRLPESPTEKHHHRSYSTNYTALSTSAATPTSLVSTGYISIVSGEPRRANAFRSVLPETRLPGCQAHLAPYRTSVAHAYQSHSMGAAMDGELPTTSSYLLTPSALLCAPVWQDPASPSSLSSTSTAAVVFVGEYSIRHVMCASTPPKYNAEGGGRALGTLLGGDPASGHAENSPFSHRWGTWLAAPSRSFSEDTPVNKRGANADGGALGACAAPPSSRQRSQGHQLFRIESDGTLCEENGQLTRRPDMDNDNNGDDDANGDGSTYRAAFIPAKRKTTIFGGACTDERRVHSRSASGKLSRKASRRSSKHSSFKSTCSSHHRRRSDAPGLSPAAGMSATAERCGAASPTSPLSGYAMTYEPDRLTSAPRASTGFHTFSAELLVFGGSAPPPRRSSSELQDDALRQQQQQSGDGEGAAAALCAGEVSSSAGSTFAPAERARQGNRGMLERTLHSTLGIIPAGHTGEDDSVVGPSIDISSSYALQGATVRTETHLPSHNGSSRRRSMLSLTATAAQSQTWFGGSILLSGDNGISRPDRASPTTAMLPVPAPPVNEMERRTPLPLQTLHFTTSSLASSAKDASGVPETNTGWRGLAGPRLSFRYGPVKNPFASTSAATPAAASPLIETKTMMAPWPTLASSGLASPLCSGHSECGSWSRPASMTSPPHTDHVKLFNGSRHGEFLPVAALNAFDAEDVVAAMAHTPSRTQAAHAPSLSSPSSVVAAVLNGSAASSAALWDTSLHSSPHHSPRGQLNGAARTTPSATCVVTPLAGVAAAASAHAMVSGTDSHASAGAVSVRVPSVASSAPCGGGPREGTVTTEGGEGITSPELSPAMSSNGYDTSLRVHDESLCSRGGRAHGCVHTPRHRVHRVESPATAKGNSATENTVTFAPVGEAAPGAHGPHDAGASVRAFAADKCTADHVQPTLLRHRSSVGPNAFTSVVKAPDTWRPRERADTLDGALSPAGSASPRASWARGVASAASSYASVERPRSVVILDDASLASGDGATPGRGEARGEVPALGISGASSHSQDSAGSHHTVSLIGLLYEVDT